VAGASGDATARRSCRLSRSQRVTDSLKEAAQSPVDMYSQYGRADWPPRGYSVLHRIERNAGGKDGAQARAAGGPAAREKAEWISGPCPPAKAVNHL
jgi:hypothetical protein